MLTGRVLILVLIAGVAGGPALARAQSAARALALGELSKSLEELAAKVSPSVVQIFVTGYAPPEEQHERATGEPAVEQSSGSGVVVDPDGLIVTNAHVVENATRLEVELPFAATGGDPGRSIVKRRGRIVAASIVAMDKETDLAVVKVEAHGLPALPFGDSDLLRPGQIVLAFGSPLGLDSSVTLGVVSAVARQLEPDDPMIYIQTDAPINPGNSGGALVDTEGRLVGINTMIYTQSGGSEGIGFAAPVNIVRNVFTQIRKFGRVRRGQVGLVPQTITPLLAEALGLPDQAGVIVADVDPDGPAGKAGLKQGDLIVTLDGKPMENGRQFRVNLYTRPIGEVVSIDILRGDRRMTVPVTVQERERDPDRLAEFAALHENTIRSLGAVVVDMNDRIAALLSDLRVKSGGVIVAVGAEAPYSQQGRLHAGDVIHAVNGTAVTGAGDVRSALAALKPGVPVALQIEREGEFMYVAFRLPR
jgi:serine protease Do